MATIDVYNLNNEAVGKVDVSDEVIGAEIRPYLLSEVVLWQRARQRAGTQCVKTKAEVSGTNKKPFAQKGGGRARQGSLRNPHQVGGGAALAPKPRSYAYSIPKSKRRAALAVALSARQNEGGLKVVEGFEFPEIKTAAVAKMLGRMNAEKTLMVDVENLNLSKSSGNLQTAKFLQAAHINVMDILRYPNLLISKAAMARVEKQLLGEEAA